MPEILSARFERTLERIVATAAPGARLEAWTFDDAASRRDAERRLAGRGVEARLRSAYKPLLAAFLEEIDLGGVESIAVRYPVHAAAPENRFRLEAYPLAALVAPRPVAFAARGDDGLFYEVELAGAGGARTVRVEAPNRVHVDLAGQTNLSPTGWIRDGREDAGRRLETDYETLFDAALEAVAGYSWGEEPYFDELNLRVTLPARDEPLPVGDEVVSLREALHEDLYFSLLELFQKRSGRPFGDRGLRPGQIVPEIVAGPGEVSLRIALRPLSTGFADAPDQVLDAAEAPLSRAQIARALDAVGGMPFSARSRSGRAVDARHRSGTDAAVMISAGQHANETTGIVGALRAATHLAARPGAHFTVSPLENPDGYALHQRLRVDNPRHMHHAARYTALGDDLEYRTEENAGPFLFEKEIRLRAEALSGARLHVNLHGYPSHEWTRPLSGYVPRHFVMWTLPKGFFLILRHHSNWGRIAEALLDSVTRRLGALPGILAENERQIALYERHAGETGFRMINGFPCLASVDDRHAAPVTLITEYPDETIYGEAFRRGHAAQMETVLSAYDAWQEIMSAPTA